MLTFEKFQVIRWKRSEGVSLWKNAACGDHWNVGSRSDGEATRWVFGSRVANYSILYYLSKWYYCQKSNHWYLFFRWWRSHIHSERSPIQRAHQAPIGGRLTGQRILFLGFVTIFGISGGTEDYHSVAWKRSDDGTDQSFKVGRFTKSQKGYMNSFAEGPRPASPLKRWTHKLTTRVLVRISAIFL